MLLIVAGVLAASGCGDTGSAGQATRSPATRANHRPATSTPLVGALAPPKVTVLRPGAKVRVSKLTLHTTGWQVACVAKGTRVSAEQIRGQHTDSMRGRNAVAREIIGRNGGTPSIWVSHDPDGSIVISCR
jgi:hypothetical protein